jgi:hypothetical protein
MSFATLSTLMGDRLSCSTFCFGRRVRGPLLIRFLADHRMEVMTLNLTVGTEVARPSDID